MRRHVKHSVLNKPVLDTQNFFDQMASEYANISKEGDELKIGLLKELAQVGDSLLDMGCGNGYFADRVLSETNISWACALELSGAMLSLNRDVPNKHLILASMLEMPFKPHSFTFIHFDEVLHHVVGTSRGSSVQQAYDILQSCISLTKKDGFLLLSECCVEPRISSVIIFYALKFLSKNKLARLFGVPSGLLVSFLTPDEFLSGIRAAGGHIVRTEVAHWRPPFFKKRGFFLRLALCRDHSRVMSLSRHP